MEFVTWVQSRDVCRHQHINNCFRCIQHPDITGVSLRARAKGHMSGAVRVPMAVTPTLRKKYCAIRSSQ